MTILYTITLLLLSAYAILLAYYHRSFRQMPEAGNIPAGFTPKTAVTVLIPARNEEINIAATVQSILNQHYPAHLLQVIVIDDHSEDQTAAIVQKFSDPRLKLLPLKNEILPNTINSYKKKAIDAGIASANGELIITTDADCHLPPGWISSLAFTFEATGAVFVAGPVKMITTGNALSVFQALDFLSLQGITAASVYKGFHSMCNGANMAYTRDAFFAVEGFKGIDDLASGDDMLLMHKIAKQFPGKIQYLKSRQAIVSTAPATSVKAFIQQRIRWASKAQAYEDKSVFRVLLLVYMLNCSLFLILVMAFFSMHNLLWALLFLAIKTGVEWPFMHSITGFYQEKKLLRWFPLFQPVHIVYTVIAGTFGQFGTYEWKGRRVR